ncbi:chemotaxis protein CheW [Beijerinckia sp. L45]|uniref:chemotaxis protein CheW n=1 Tax=Beijerinckia sp. L45 TaxID=1641855 RepID=UPI00131B437C|nr:chemotaxis protein CheW [Beijerinckia sp. L45]
MTREQATAPSAPGSFHKPDENRCFTVVSEGRTFGLPVESIQTVFEMVALTPVPLAPYEILGLVNLRGKIVTAVSLRRRLKADAHAVETSMLAIGMEHRGESFALVVDEVGDVIILDPGTRIVTPPHLGAEGIKISAVHRLDAMILPLLDLDWVFTFSRATEVRPLVSTL